MLANQLLHTRTALFLFVFVCLCVCVFDFVCEVSSTELQSDMCKSCRKKASHRVHIKVISTVLKLKAQVVDPMCKRRSSRGCGWAVCAPRTKVCVPSKLVGCKMTPAHLPSSGFFPSLSYPSGSASPNVVAAGDTTRSARRCDLDATLRGRCRPAARVQEACLAACACAAAVEARTCVAARS